MVLRPRKPNVIFYENGLAWSQKVLRTRSEMSSTGGYVWVRNPTMDARPPDTLPKRESGTGPTGPTAIDAAAETGPTGPTGASQETKP